MRALVCVVLVSACSPPAAVDPLPFEPAGPNAAPDPAKLGPFPVGVRTVTHEDRRRPKPDGSPRKLLDTTLLNTLGWKPRIELREGIAHAYQCFLEEEASGRLRGA